MLRRDVRCSSQGYWCLVVLTGWLALAAHAEDAFRPMALPGGRLVVTDTSKEFLVPPENLKGGDFTIAKTPPTIDFAFYPEQTYPGNPWSAWGDNIVAGDKWYSAIGDHQWDAFVYEYDIPAKKLRTVVKLKDFLKMPAGHYTPGKVHSRIDVGSDGWVYFATHRGASAYTTDKYHFKGDWILRYNPQTEKTETICHGPVGKESIPVSILDPERLIFYGGTQQSGVFFAYDVKAKKLLYQSKPGEGPYRYMMFSKSTGRVYYLPGDYGTLRRYDPKTNTSTVVPAKIGIRAATLETPQGYIYATATKRDGRIYRFDVKKETAEEIGNVRLSGKDFATADYVTTIDADPTGTYLYYCAGSAHGRCERGGTPIVQFNVKTRQKKVIAFLHPFYEKRYQFVPDGTYGSSLSPDGDKLCITWMGRRTDIKVKYTNSKRYCAMTVIHIPESERQAKGG